MRRVFKLVSTRLQNSATICATILPMLRRYHESSKRPRVVSPAYQVRTEDGVLVDESPVSAPLDYLHGHGSLISGTETALEGHEVGDKFDVAVGANDAYGQYDENLVQRVPKDVFMGVDELQVGMRFWLKPTRVRYRLKSLRLKTITSWLMVTTCWPVRT